MRHSYDDVDFSQRTAVPPEEDSEWILKVLKEILPYWYVWSDPEAEKRLRDSLRDVPAGQESTPQAVARARHAENERFFSNPEEWQKQIPPKL